MEEFANVLYLFDKYFSTSIVRMKFDRDLFAPPLNQILDMNYAKFTRQAVQQQFHQN